MSKTIIIGAGIAGIAASIRLAQKGHDVTVYETNAYPGGKLSSFEQDGFRFDAGPSLFTLPSLVTDLFELCGEQASAYFNYHKQDTSCHYFWSDGSRFDMPGNRNQIPEAIEQFFNTDQEEVEKYLKKSQYKYELTAPVFLEKSLHKLNSYTNWQTVSALLKSGALDVFSSLDKVNKKAFKDPKLVQLFNRYATYNGSSPYKSPGIMSMIPHLEMGIGTFFPKGGMQSITTCLVALAKRQGVEFVYNTPVDQVWVEGGKVKGVVTKEKQIAADVVVSNMDVFSTYKRLLPESKHPEKILSQERSSSALIFYWGVEGNYDQLDLHNILFSDHYKEEFECIFDHKTIHRDPTVYINISSKCNPDDAPKGCENWFVMINAPGDVGQDWPTLIGEARKNIRRKIESTLGISLEGRIKTESILEPRLIESKTQSHQGALYGTASNNRYASFLRHANFNKEYKNLYFCGGSVHPGGGIPLCLNSAKIVANLISK